MEKTTYVPQITREEMVWALAALRQEWEETSPDGLITVKASVGMLLADMAAALNLTPYEQEQALGHRLYAELRENANLH